jgi:membrane protein
VENEMAGLRQWVSGRIDEFKGAFKKFGAEDGALIAAAISFYGLLTLLPILLLGVAVLGFVVGSSDKAFDTVVSFFNSFMPTSTFVVETLRGLVRARGTIGWIGIVSLLWTGSQFFVTVQTSMDGIWEVGAKPGYIKTRVKGIVMLIVFGVFLMISVASSSLTSLLQHWQATGGFASDAVADLLSALAFVISLLFSIAMFLVVYRWEPDTSDGTALAIRMDWSEKRYL